MVTIQLTLEALQKLIDDRIATQMNERLAILLDKFEIGEDELFADEDEFDHLTWDEIRESVEKHRWTPPPGAKSSLEYLREDRER
jgi:hypothetical protein